MQLVLIRRWLSDNTTIGELFVDPKNEGDCGFQCYTLEDRYRGDDPADKVPGATCIPCGQYEVTIDYSPKFKVDMPHVMNVPGYEGIRFHAGNDATDTEGCILVGQERAPDRIELSRPAYANLCQRLRVALARGEKLMLRIQLDVGVLIPPYPLPVGP